MNRFSEPSRAPASRINSATSAVTSTKPVPLVCTVSSEVTMLLAVTAEIGERDVDLFTELDFPRNVLLHAIGHVDQSAPGALQKRHHAVHVLIARQRNLDLAFALGGLRRGLLVRFRQCLIGLVGGGGFARGQLRLQLFVLRLQASDLFIHRLALIGHGVTGPAAAGIVAIGYGATSRIEADDTVALLRQRVTAVLGVRRRRFAGGGRSANAEHEKRRNERQSQGR